jgi:hypothetical protein
MWWYRVQARFIVCLVMFGHVASRENRVSGCPHPGGAWLVCVSAGWWWCSGSLLVMWCSDAIGMTWKDEDRVIWVYRIQVRLMVCV